MEKLIKNYIKTKSGAISFEMRKPAETMEEYELLEKELKEIMEKENRSLK